MSTKAETLLAKIQEKNIREAVQGTQFVSNLDRRIDVVDKLIRGLENDIERLPSLVRREQLPENPPPRQATAQLKKAVSALTRARQPLQSVLDMYGSTGD